MSRGALLHNRPPLRRKRSLRNTKTRLVQSNGGIHTCPGNGSFLESMNQLDIQNPALYGRGPSELGSVADESLTSCTGPISQDESDFSSFNYNSASMSAGSRNFENNG